MHRLVLVAASLLVAIGLFLTPQVDVPHFKGVAHADGISAPIAVGPIGQSDAAFKYPPVTGGGGCSQATALLARMDGTENTSAVTTLICAMVTDGTYSTLDGLYVFATSNTTNATLNWAQNAFNLSWTNLSNCTLTANNYITGDGSTCFANTGFTPSTAGGQMTQNSASLGICVVNSRTLDEGYAGAGATDGSNYTYNQPKTGGNYTYDVQGGTFPGFTTSNAQGSWIQSRTSSAGLTLYENGTSVQTPTDLSGPLISRPIYIMAYNAVGTATDFSADSLAYVLFGSGSNSTQAANIRSRLQNYISAVGGSGC